jgi:hypothetical protein
VSDTAKRINSMQLKRKNALDAIAKNTTVAAVAGIGTNLKLTLLAPQVNSKSCPAVSSISTTKIGWRGFEPPTVPANIEG